MTEPHDLAQRLRAELEAAAPDVWPRVRQRVEAGRVASDLLARLERPPTVRGALYWQLRFRLRHDMTREAV